MASIVVKQDEDDSSKLELDFARELGDTNHEGHFQNGKELEIDTLAIKTLSPRNFEARNVRAGKCSAPPGFPCSLGGD